MESNKRITLLTLFLLLSLGVFRFANKSEPQSRQDLSSIDPHSELAERTVNKHLSLTDQQVNLQNERARLEAPPIPAIGDQIWPSAETHEDYKRQRDGVDLSSDPREQVALDDLNRHPKEYGNYKSPHSVVQSEQAAIEEESANHKAYQEKYAQQFLENARKNGYQVRLDEHYRVIDVRKIPSQGSLPSNSPKGGGSR